MSRLLLNFTTISQIPTEDPTLQLPEFCDLFLLLLASALAAAPCVNERVIELEGPEPVQ
jgi:hypothetical protein